MAFDHLPPQTPFVTEPAKRYAASIRERSQAASESCRCVLDVAYGADYWQRVDFYLPADRTVTGAPVLVYLHGGAWQRGYKEDMGFMAPPLVDLPAVFVSVSYRLAPAHKLGALLDDTVSAIALVHRTVATLGGDPRRMAIGGHSAGGHLAALATLRPDLLAAKGLPRDVIRFCLPVAAPFAFEAGRDDETIAALLSAPSEAAIASPIEHVRPDVRTPFHITWADGDLPNIVRTGPPMVERLTAAGVPVTAEEMANMDHFDISLAHGDPDGAWVRRVSEILKGL